MCGAEVGHVIFLLSHTSLTPSFGFDAQVD